MGKPADHPPVMLVTAIFSRYPEALAWAKAKTTGLWGPICIESPCLPFRNTHYYEKEMGPDLMLQLLAFADLISPLDLPAIKLATNTMESAYLAESSHSELRPLNIDPGYLTPAKFVLATTKDNSHRLFLGQGIYGEVTLRFVHGEWRHWEWTYPNYREQEYEEFFSQCRRILRGIRRV